MERYLEVHTCRLNMNFSHQSKLPLCTILQKSVAFLLIPCDSMKLSIIYIKMNILQSECCFSVQLWLAAACITTCLEDGQYAFWLPEKQAALARPPSCRGAAAPGPAPCFMPRGLSLLEEIPRWAHAAAIQGAYAQDGHCSGEISKNSRQVRKMMREKKRDVQP